jgi:FMN phosphatase YigB (HAD superfamily)
LKKFLRNHRGKGVQMSRGLRAILFDLHGTLGYVKKPVTAEEFCIYLQSRGYDVYPQSFTAARNFVGMVAYPKHGYSNFADFYSEVLRMLDVKVEADTALDLSKLFAEREQFQPYPDAERALVIAKEHGMRTAIVTTIARFHFESILAKIGQHVDIVMDGFEAGCEKSNPLMYRKVLRALRVHPSEAVMIGDEEELDIVLPKKLGVKAILLRRKGGIPIRTKADGVVLSLTQGVRMVLSSRRRGEFPNKINGKV